MFVFYRTDDTDAHDNTFLKIRLRNRRLRPISKIILSVNYGELLIPYYSENNFQVELFELTLNFTSEETRKLKNKNTIHVVVYDMQNRQRTCRKYYTFETIKGVLGDDK